MPEVKIADGQHVIRVCKRRNTIRNNGALSGVHPEFFKLRDNPDGTREKYLSSFHFEFFEGDEESRYAQTCNALPFVPDGDNALVKLCAATMRKVGKERRVDIRVFRANASRPYSKITGVPFIPHIELVAALCALSVKGMMKVSDVRASRAPSPKDNRA
jgi:hypothetical protein